MDQQHDKAAHTWDQLVVRLEGFLAAWEAGGEPPNLGDHLPASPASLRHLTLVELIKADLDYRWRQNRGKRLLEDYVELFPELTIGNGLPADVIYEEFHIRRQAGERLDPSEYFQRFPTRVDELKRLLNMDEQSVTTSLVPTRRIDEVFSGERIDDFDLMVQLGKGAFASVFLARQRSLQRLVALKVSADRGTEAQTLAPLDHPHIVRVYDQRSVPDRRLRLLYMQFVPGGTLQEVIRGLSHIPPELRTEADLQKMLDARMEEFGQAASLDIAARQRQAESRWPEVVCRIGSQLAEALDYAHRQGVLHRDVKPANVLLTSDGKPKLADFNISFSSQVDGATPAAYFGGSLAYMSPEQLEACNPSHERTPDELDGRSDQYSLAVMLWELLTGKRPFGEEDLDMSWNATLVQLTDRRQKGAPPAPEGTQWGRAHECADQLFHVLRRCLSPNPADRFASGSVLARELSLCLSPRTGQLLRVPDDGWRGWAWRYCLVAVLLAVLIPNGFAGAFNYFYNEKEIIEKLDEAQAETLKQGQALAGMKVREAFGWVALFVNGIAFPLGALLGYFVIAPLADYLRRPADQPISADEMAALRRHVLKIGNYAALIGIVEWLIAGVAFPICLHILTGGILESQHYLHFAASMTICGLIAAAYPFFFVTFLVARVYYPLLISRDPHQGGDEQELLSLSRWCGIFLVMAAAVPMAGVLMLVFFDSANKPALVSLSLLAGAGFALAFFTYRLIQGDLLALRQLSMPGEVLSVSSSSIWDETLR